MQTYKAPLRDMRFVLHELHDSATLTQLRGLEDISPELMDSILEEAGKLAEEVLLPTNTIGDELGCVLENGVVRTPKGFKDAYDAFRNGGWTALAADPQYGGQGLPGQPFPIGEEHVLPVHELRDPEAVRRVRHDAAAVREGAQDPDAGAGFDRSRHEHDVGPQKLLVRWLHVAAQVHRRM